MSIAILNTPLGIAKIEGDSNGISSITVNNTDSKVSEIIPETLRDCVIQLKEYFQGTRNQFSLTLNPKGTDFQKKVWNELQKIPYGKTITYLDLAKKVGNVKSIRAAANAKA